MAEKVTLNPEPFSRNYDGKPFIIFQSTDVEKVGDKISPQNGTDFSTNLLTPIDKQTYERLEQKGTSSLVKNTNPQGVESYFGVIGKVQGDKLEFSDIIDEFPRSIIDSLEKDAPELVKESKDSLNTYLKNKNLSTSSSTSPVIPNQGSTTQQEQPSTPVATSLGRGVSFKSGSSILVYPANMSDSQDRIQFSVWKYKNRKLTFNEGDDPERAGLSAIAEVENLDLKASTPGKEFNNYELAKNKDNTNFPFVYLPITKISDTNSVDWNEDRLNTLQMQLARISMAAMRPSDVPVNSALSETQKLLEWTQQQNFSNMALTYLAGQAVGVGGLLTRTTGGIFNPNLELLFQSPQLRQFAFSFSMFAKNGEEATKIKSIIKYFKQNMAPRVESDSNIFLNSPYVFRIKYLSGNPKGGSVENTPDHPSIGKIKMCALQSCTTDYTPLGSYMTFNDTDDKGKPTSTMVMYNMTLNFKELHPIYDVDYNDAHPIGF